MIAIVGGGISGLALGFELQRRGADFVVLEATDRVGGVIRSAEVDGRILDWGPQRTRLTKPIAQMLDALDLTTEVVTAPEGLELLVYRDGRLRTVPFSAGAFVGSDIVSFRGKLRALIEPFTAGPDPAESVASFFTRKVGRELYETLVAPLYGGLYASDPADMRVGLSLIHVLREFGVQRSLLLPLLRRGGRISPPAACTFAHGMETLPRTLAATLGDRVRVGTPAREIRRDSRGWSVVLDDGAIEADAVVLTAPAPATGDLLAPVAPAAADSIRALRYNPLGVVHLDAETDLVGLGFQVAFTESDLMMRGVTFNDALFGRTNLYTAYLGGARHPEVADMDQDEIGAVAVREFRQCTGGDARVLSVARERMPAWDVTWEGIQGLSLPEGLHIAANWWSRPGLPGRLAEAQRLATSLAGPVDLSDVETDA